MQCLRMESLLGRIPAPSKGSPLGAPTPLRDLRWTPLEGPGMFITFNMKLDQASSIALLDRFLDLIGFSGPSVKHFKPTPVSIDSMGLPYMPIYIDPPGTTPTDRQSYWQSRWHVPKRSVKTARQGPDRSVLTLDPVARTYCSTHQGGSRNGAFRVSMFWSTWR